MDRSVDSIGSCSLDVDADSTDFSDTSGELNFLTPISGKDITREFTAGIKERCMLPVINCQAVTSVLDPVTGHISTVLTTTATSQQHAACPTTQPLLGGSGGAGGDTSPPALASNKKPSYLNLACCVNGYSNLTTYDSKLRQDINKSREVSPSRPIIATLHYNRTEAGGGGGGGGHLLTAPTLSYVSMNNTINNNYSSGASATNRMFKMNGTTGTTANGGGVGGGGRLRGMNGSAVSPLMGADVTDNAAANGLFNGNGSFLGSGMTLRSSKVISSQSQISSLTRDGDHHPTATAAHMLMTPKKSFIQQRVEKLYGASEGVVINKQYYSSSERKYLNNIANENHGGANCQAGAVHGKGGAGQSITNGNGAVLKNGVGNGHHPSYLANDWTTLGTVDENNRQIATGEDGEGAAEPEVESLPVLRHLRPEFRAQLQIFSPKKVPKASSMPNGGSATAPAPVNGNNNLLHSNGTSPAAMSQCDAGRHNVQTNGNSQIDTREEFSADDEHANRSTTTVSMKSARISTHITNTSTTTSSSSNGTTTISSASSSNEHHQAVEKIEEEYSSSISSSNRHHSNNSTTRTVTVLNGNDTEEKPHQHHTTTSHGAGSPLAPDTTVEEQMRSLVVVPPPPPPSSSSQPPTEEATASSCVSSQRTSTVGDDVVVVPDTDTGVLKSATAASVIENGEQNGAVVGSRSSELEIVGAAVHCDSSAETADKQALENNNMRTSNGDTTVVVGVAPTNATILPVVMMAGIERHHADAEQDNRRAKSAVKLLAPAQPILETFNGDSSHNNNDVLDGNYFLQILKTERHRLQTMADALEKEIGQLKDDGVVLGEELNGYILVVVGKARLLCSQKMKQFEDLCYTNLNQSPDEKFQTTGEDLRGFWDMVMLQVNNVDATFVEIDSFRKNGWRKPSPQTPPPVQARNGAPRTKLVKRPYKTQTNGAAGSTVTDGNGGGAAEAKKASAALAAAKREAQRKQLMEMKRKQKLANSQPAVVEIFAPSGEEQPSAGQLNGGGDAQRTAVNTS